MEKFQICIPRQNPNTLLKLVQNNPSYFYGVDPANELTASSLGTVFCKITKGNETIYMTEKDTIGEMNEDIQKFMKHYNLKK